MIEELIKVAKGELGYYEKASNKDLNSKTANKGKNNYTKYGQWLGYNPGHWCHMFVSWCAYKAKIGKDIIPRTGSCDLGMTAFQDKKRWQKAKAWGGKYTPKRGDIIYFSSTGKTCDSTHVGIVTGVSDGKVKTIEGNAGDCVKEKAYSLGDKYILGYGTPVYVEDKPEVKPEVKPSSGGKTTYKVQPGDTLSEIAEKFDVTVAELVKANDIDNPNVIHVGDVLVIPGDEPVYHTVKNGDTISEIAEKYKTTVDKICKLNNIKNKNLIFVGERLRVK